MIGIESEPTQGIGPTVDQDGFAARISNACRARTRYDAASALLVVPARTADWATNQAELDDGSATRHRVHVGPLDPHRLGILLERLDASTCQRLRAAQAALQREGNGARPIDIVLLDAPAVRQAGGPPTAEQPLDESAEPDLVDRFPADPDRGLPAWKRVIDIALAGATLLVLSPLMILIAAGIKIVDPGPVLFTQERIGYRGRPFKVFKFRSMKRNTPTDQHREHFRELMRSGREMFKLDPADPRLIPLGTLMRATALDELPQLFNVLRGDMSLVGPRPCIPYEYEAYEPWQRLRTIAVPGMTGLWQVSGKNKTSFNQMIALDIQYALTKSPILDLRIIVSTPRVLFEQLMDTIRSKGRST